MTCSDGLQVGGKDISSLNIRQMGPEPVLKFPLLEKFLMMEDYSDFNNELKSIELAIKKAYSPVIKPDEKDHLSLIVQAFEVFQSALSELISLKSRLILAGQPTQEKTS